jgi:hypothetical protein
LEALKPRKEQATMTKPMPIINLDTLKAILPAADYELVVGIVATQGKNKGRLRASKPNVTRTASGKTSWGSPMYVPDLKEGCTAYIWRMVAFSISPVSQHQCLPMLADFDLPLQGDECREMVKRLDAIADIVVKSVPVTQHHGTLRWGNALGMVGMPAYNEEGAVVYRGLF